MVVDAMTYYKALDGVSSMIVVDAIMCYETFDRVESTIVVDTIACYGTLDKVNTVKEWHVATQCRVNVWILWQVNGTNIDLVNEILLTNYRITYCIPQTICMIITPVHDSSKNNLIEHPLLKNVVVLNEQSSVAYNVMQPTSQYITSVWSILSISSDYKQFRDVMNSFIQGFIQRHAGLLMIDILTWCHKILSTFHENYLLFLNFYLSIQRCCQKMHLMLNWFRHHKHDFNVSISKI